MRAPGVGVRLDATWRAGAPPVPWQGDITQCHWQSVRDRRHSEAESALTHRCAILVR
jgi:hypothetical protein